jgi:hypothetical protein
MVACDHQVETWKPLGGRLLVLNGDAALFAIEAQAEITSQAACARL